MAVNYKKWLLDYKLLHVLMWTLCGISSYLAYYDPKDDVVGAVLNALVVELCSMVPFYTTAYVLIPDYLYKRKFVKFILLLVLLILASAFGTLFIIRIGTHIFDSNIPIMPQPAHFRILINLWVWNSLLAAFGAGGLKIMSDSFRLRKQLMEVEKEKISTELNFLRSQINPHFLFNVLNTIYFQINKENTPARESVEKLSKMLRYQLYECTNDKIDISKEVGYIKNYFAMQLLRMEEDSDIRLTIEDNIPAFKIAPLLILPLVENAFKHISTYREPGRNMIHISLASAPGNLFAINVVNSYDASHAVKDVLNYGGLGLQNLKRRLELLYPDRHELRISDQDHLFQTTLQLKYND